MNEPGSNSSDFSPLGIDLGTTYSVVATLDAYGQPQTILNPQGHPLTRSAVLVDGQDIVVGQEAVTGSTSAPDCYADVFKVDLGRPFFRRKVAGLDVPPEVLSGFVLRYLREFAEEQLGDVRPAVITVPAFFDERRRIATRNAGRAAGLDVVDIINEPTAAALAASHQGSQANAGAERILVYDLGGGTFDVTVVEVNGLSVRTLATDGEVELGGRDFDGRLVQFLSEQFSDQHGLDPRSDPADALALWQQANQVKHTLSQRPRVKVTVSAAGLRTRVEMTQEQLSELTADLLGRTETTCELVMRSAGLKWPDIDRVLLVGGSTRLPGVSDLLTRISGRSPQRAHPEDQIVAHGAALYCASLLGRGSMDVSLSNVNAHSLGIVGFHKATQSRRTVVLIPKNTPLPHEATRAFPTARDNQANVLIEVVEGESEHPEECILLGQCAIDNLPEGMPAGTRVEVTYRYESAGFLNVLARVPAARKTVHAQIRRQATEELEPLDVWARRLTSQDGGDAETTLVRRLDGLYIDIGKANLRSPVPDSLVAAQRAALDAEREQRTSEVALQSQSRFGADHPLTRSAQARVEETTQLLDFALLVLGRESAALGVVPPHLVPLAEQAKKLARQLGQV